MEHDDIKRDFDDWVSTVSATTEQTLAEAYLKNPAGIRMVEEFLWNQYETYGHRPEAIYFAWFGEYPQTNRELAERLVAGNRNRLRVQQGLEPIPLYEV